MVNPIAFACLHVHNHLELSRLFNRQIAGLRSFENLVHVTGGTAEKVFIGRPIGHQSALFDELAVTGKAGPRLDILSGFYCSLALLLEACLLEDFLHDAKFALNTRS